MGQCATGTRSASPKKESFERQPAGTEALRHKTLPKLFFHATLANVRLKNYPFNKALAYFRVREGESFSLAAKNSGDEGTILWRINEAFDFQMTEYELRKQFLQISILKENGEQAASIKINLFLIATGPFHQDFSLKIPTNKAARISFDLKISQIIDLKIQSLESEILLHKKHPGEEFCYSIKTINGFSGCSVESQDSYPAMVLLQNKSEDSTESIDPIQDLSGLVRRKSNRELPKQIEEGGELKWANQGGYLPVIETKVVASELHNIYFQILIWKYQSQLESTKQLFADTYVSLYKLLGNQARTLKEEGKQLQSRNIKMTQKIEHGGKNVGIGNFQFTIINQTYFKQYLLCVHTEDGIQKTNPIFGVVGTTSNDKCPELQNLLSLSDEVEQNVITLNKLQTNEGSRYEIRRLAKQIQEDLNSIYELLEKSSFSPIYLYQYSSEQQLLEGQKILVELGVKITQYIQSQDPITNDLCWLILISLIKRGQFNLNHMGFNQKQKKQILANNLDSPLLFKQEVANMYRAFLHKLLDLSLNSIDHKGSDFQRTFAQIFGAFSYFRIPEFRKEIKRLITHEGQPEIMQWRDVDFNLSQEPAGGLAKDKTNIFKEMFDWEYHFYKYLRRNDRIENNSLSIQQIITQNSWKGRFLKRGNAFFYFIKYWVTYVESALPNSFDVQWIYFPGYTRLIRCFLLQLKNRPILQYPDSLVEATLKLLLNQKLVNPIVSILVTKARALDSSAVMKVIEYLNLIFQSVGKRLGQLPISFNYSFLFKAIKIVLDVDFSVATSAALTLIYSNFGYFHVEFRRAISMYLLGSAFFKLFLHWSHNVRHIFNYLVAYKIYGDALQEAPFPGQSVLSHRDIISRYEEMMKILTLELKNYLNSSNLNLHPSIDRCLFKKMKIKLFERLKKKNHIRYGALLDSEAYFNKSIQSLKEHQLQKSQSDMDSPLKSGQRANSELWTHAKITLVKRQTEHNTHKKEDIKRSSRFNEFSYVHDHNSKKSSLFHTIIPEKQFIIPEINPEQLKHIEVCLTAYKEVEKQFAEGAESGHYEAPAIEHEISIDKRQIRPKQFDQW